MQSSCSVFTGTRYVASISSNRYSLIIIFVIPSYILPDSKQRYDANRGGGLAGAHASLSGSLSKTNRDEPRWVEVNEQDRGGEEGGQDGDTRRAESIG